MACHLRIASDVAKFGQPEVKLGIAPGYGGTQRLPRLVGRATRFHLILTGEMIDARSNRIGLVNQVVPAAELLADGGNDAAGYPRHGPTAVRLALEAVDQGLEMDASTRDCCSKPITSGCFAATEDMKEG